MYYKPEVVMLATLYRFFDMYEITHLEKIILPFNPKYEDKNQAKNTIEQFLKLWAWDISITNVQKTFSKNFNFSSNQKAKHKKIIEFIENKKNTNYLINIGSIIQKHNEIQYDDKLPLLNKDISLKRKYADLLRELKGAASISKLPKKSKKSKEYANFFLLQLRDLDKMKRKKNYILTPLIQIKELVDKIKLLEGESDIQNKLLNMSEILFWYCSAQYGKSSKRFEEYKKWLENKYPNKEPAEYEKYSNGYDRYCGKDILYPWDNGTKDFWNNFTEFIKENDKELSDTELEEIRSKDYIDTMGIKYATMSNHYNSNDIKNLNIACIYFYNGAHLVLKTGKIYKIAGNFLNILENDYFLNEMNFLEDDEIKISYNSDFLGAFMENYRGDYHKEAKEFLLDKNKDLPLKDKIYAKIDGFVDEFFNAENKNSALKALRENLIALLEKLNIGDAFPYYKLSHLERKYNKEILNYSDVELKAYIAFMCDIAKSTVALKFNLNPNISENKPIKQEILNTFKKISDRTQYF